MHCHNIETGCYRRDAFVETCHCLCPECSRHSRLSNMLHPGPDIRIREWVIDFAPFTGKSLSVNRHECIIPPGGKVEMLGRPQVNNFTPARLTISSAPNARLVAEMTVGNECFPLGSCDAWMRYEGQKPTAYIKHLSGISPIGPSYAIKLVLTNEFHVKPVRATIHVHGTFKDQMR